MSNKMGERQIDNKCKNCKKCIPVEANTKSEISTWGWITCICCVNKIDLKKYTKGK